MLDNGWSLGSLYVILTPVLLRLVYAIVILVLGLMLARLVVRVFRRIMTARNVELTISNFMCRLIHAILVIFILLAALAQLGVQTASLVAILGAMSLAVGLSLRSSLSNLASGILLIIFRPIKTGDFIQVGGAEGSVEEINILFTELVTPSNQVLVVPNSNFMSNVITNYSSKVNRRCDITIGIGYNDPISKAKDVLQQLLDADDRVLSLPEAPLIAVNELADSSVNILVRFWTSRSNFWVVKRELMEAIKCRFDEEGLSIPFPQLDVHVNQ